MPWVCKLCLTGLCGETLVPSISLRSRADGAAERLLALDDDHEGKKYDVRMHIALTRATAGVILVCDEEDLPKDPRLAKLAGLV
jgi:hypothetical protein